MLVLFVIILYFKIRKKKKFCPTCNREVLVVNNKTSRDHEAIEKNAVQKNNNNITTDKKLIIPDFDFLKEVIIKKTQILIEKLNTESQLDLLERYTDLLLKLIDIWNKITT